MGNVLVIGGGASGMVAAIAAARRGARVRIVERMRRVGKKLLATGNGRCNLTNLNAAPSHYHGQDTAFVEPVLQAFGVKTTLAFFEELGIEAAIETDGNVYPASYQASSVLDLLRYELERLGVETLCDRRVQRLLPTGNAFRVTCTDADTLHAERVILAAGGQSAPNLGSNGSGFKIAAALGHTLVHPFPALVQLRVDAPFLKRLDGLKVNARVSACIGGVPQRTEDGEILFASYGLSGPPIFQISRIASQGSLEETPVALTLDLFPQRPVEDLGALIAKRVETAPHKPVSMSFVGLLHKRLIPVLLEEAGIQDHNAPSASLSPAAIAHLAETMKAWTMPCTGPRSWMYSQVTAGGVATSEVNPATMESRLTPGLHLCGEVLDIDGDCGGFNLQWAWSTGHLAGQAAATT